MAQTSTKPGEVSPDDFPILCETCLGPNPYVRMLVAPHGGACKICDRPFTVYRWKAGNAGARYKKTEICRTCSRLKNACQTCIFDLRFGLPVQVRDKAMGDASKNGVVVRKPGSEANREYMAAVNQRKVEEGKVDGVFESGIPKEGMFVKGLVRNGRPKYERNKARICSFFVKGECSRGLYCPYRHEMPVNQDSPLAKQNIKDRYYGVNDPVAEAMLAGVRKRKRGTGVRAGGEAQPPDDENVKTLFVGGLKVDEPLKEEELSIRFGQHGKVTSVRVIQEKGIAFVEMETRRDAETVMNKLHDSLKLKGQKCNLNWAKPSQNSAKRAKIAT